MLHAPKEPNPAGPTPIPAPRPGLRARRSAVLGLALGALACGRGPQPTDDRPEHTLTLAGVAVLSGLDGTFPIEAESADGSRFRLDAPADRILAGNAAVLDYLAAIGVADRIVAAPERAPDYSIAAANGQTYPASALLSQLDSENVIGIAPNLAVVHGWQPLEQRVQWRRTGLALVDLPDVRTFADTLEVLDLLALLTGTTERFAPDRAALTARAEALTEQAAGAGSSALAYVNSGTGGWVAGSGTTADAAFALVGLRNAAAEWTGHSQVEIEEVLRLDPDFLVITPAPGEQESSTLAFLRTEPRLQNLRALRDERFLVVDGNLWASNSHHVLDAAEALGRQLDETP